MKLIGRYFFIIKTKYSKVGSNKKLLKILQGSNNHGKEKRKRQEQIS